MLLLAAAIAGAVLGLLGGKLADWLPRRYGVTHFAPAEARRRRTIVLVLVCAAVSFGIARLLGEVPDLRLGTAAVLFGVNAVVAALVLAGGAIDVEHMILPNEITIGATVICLLSSPLRSVGIKGACAGAVLGLVLTYGPFLVYKLVRRHSGMGLGDAKLAIAAGAWHGLEGAVFVIAAGALQQLLAAAILRAAGKSYEIPESVRAELAELREAAAAGDAEARDALADDPLAANVEDGALKMRLPLGPFLVLASIEVLFLRRWLLTNVVAWFLE